LIPAPEHIELLKFLYNQNINKNTDGKLKRCQK
jgi:hypothetical protein